MLSTHAFMYSWESIALFVYLFSGVGCAGKSGRVSSCCRID
jgi:hypothetical protein